MVRRSALALIVFTSLAGISPAFGAEEPPLVTTILKNWESQLKAKPTYQSLTTESDGSVVINGLPQLRAAGRWCGKMSLTTGKIKLSGITDKGNGLFEVASAQYQRHQDRCSQPRGELRHLLAAELGRILVCQNVGRQSHPAGFLRASMNVAKKMSSGTMTPDGGGTDFLGRQL